MKKKILNIIYISIIAILVIVSSCLIYQQVSFFNIVVVGHSMSGTLEEGQIGAARKIKYVNKINRGDIIIFNRSNASEEDYEVIKRVIGLPKDKIELKNNEVYINEILYEENYLKNNNDKELTNHGNEIYFNLTLKEDEYFVMGDNRKSSYDSRFYGTIKKEDIVGKLRVIYKEGECKNSCEEINNKKSIPWKFY